MSPKPILRYYAEELKRPINIQNSSLSYLLLLHRENLQRSRADRFTRCLDRAWTKFGITRSLILHTKTQSKKISIEDAKTMKREFEFNCILKAKIEHMETFKRLSRAEKKEVLAMRRKQIISKHEETYQRDELTIGALETNMQLREQMMMAFET